MWNGNNGQFINTFQGHSGPITGGKFTPEGLTIQPILYINLIKGHYVVSISEDKTMRVWNPKNGDVFHKISGNF